jgi:large subunit ribosomal protein L10
MLKKDKEQVVERLRGSDTLILADYRGLSVSELDDVRTKLLEHGARFTVVKNTLTRRAASEAGLETLTGLLDGPTAIAFVGDGDMVAVAKTLNDTAKRTKVLEIKGGILQGVPLGAGQVVELALLPPADVLQGQVLGAIVGPLTSIVALFAAPLQDFVGLLDARVDQLGGAEAAPADAPEETADETPQEASADTPEVPADEAAEETTEEE